MDNASARPRNVQPFRKNGNHLTPQQFARVCEEVMTFLPMPTKEAPDESRESSERTNKRAVMNATRLTRSAQIVEIAKVTAATASAAKTKSNPLPAMDVILSKYVDAIGGRAAHERLKSRVITVR